MFYTSRSIGGSPNKNNSFNQRGYLPVKNINPLSEYTLSNSQSSFTFREDGITGVSLYSFKASTSSSFRNHRKSLWGIVVIPRVEYVEAISQTYMEHYTVYPTKATFNPGASTLTPTAYLDGQRLQFVWSNIKYDRLYPDRTCQVTITAYLPDSSPYIKLSCELKYDSAIPSDFTAGYTVTAIQMPSLSIESDTSSAENEVLTLGDGMGITFVNPVKNVESPRFYNENLNYKYSQQDGTVNYKFLKGGQPSVPTINTNRITLGSPGYMSIPLAIWGDRSKKEGFLYFAEDSDGIHAKTCQYFSDGKRMQLRMADSSDFEYEPYGLGGKESSPLSKGNATNTVGWSVGILPFKSVTKWVDWQGCYLYKQHVVPVLEEYGWIPKSFYERYVSGEFDRVDYQIPFYVSTHSNIRDDIGHAVDAAKVYQSQYQNVNTSSIAPRVLLHYQSAVLNYSPIESGQTWYGWEAWGTGETAPGAHKFPDFSINSLHSESFLSGAASNITPMLYLADAFVITSGSQWTQNNNAFDYRSKSFQNAASGYTASTYNDYISNLSVAGSVFTTSTYQACMAVTPCYDKYVEETQKLGNSQVGIYHDTIGQWGRGCYAHTHSGSGEYTHPRGGFSHYYNQQQLNWLSGATDSLQQANYSGADYSGTIKNALAQSCEFATDASLKYIPAAIPISFASNSDFGIYSNDINRDGLRTDLIVATPLVSGMPYTFGIRRAPIYKQATPVFTTIYGDRSITADWSSPSFGNLLQASGDYIQSQAVTGYRDDGKTLFSTPTHDERLTQLRNIVTEDFHYFGRMHFYHQALDSKNWDTVNKVISSGYAYSGLDTEDPTDLITDPLWSDYFNYIKQLFRVQSYAPDYIYHGTLKQPLEFFVSEIDESGVFLELATRPSNFYFSSPTGYFESESVTHTIRESREGNSYMLLLSNWRSGDSTFSGEFTPDTYGIDTEYEIYSLDLTSGSAGTVTKIADLAPSQNYTFNLTLSGQTSLAYQISPVTSIRNSGLADFESNYVHVRYGYNSTELTTDSIDVVYSYNACDSFVPSYEGFRAPATQEIVNNLPQWMDVRKDTSSRGWKVVNSWGMNLEDIVSYTTESIQNLYLSTADRSLERYVYQGPITFTSHLIEPSFKNLLFNSSFYIPAPAVYNKPSGWSIVNGELSQEKSAISSHSVKLSTNGKLSQSIELQQNLDNLTASTYVYSSDSNVKVQLILLVEDEYGIVTSSSAELTGESLEWRRLVLTHSVTGQVYKAHLIIRSLSTTGNVYISCPQLETTPSVSNWTPSSRDSNPIFATPSSFSFIVADAQDNTGFKVPLFPLATEEEFLSISVPTRLVEIKYPEKNIQEYAEQEYGRKVTFHEEVETIQWVPNSEGTALLEKTLTPTTHDVYGEYTLEDLITNEEGEVGILESCNISRQILSTAVRDNYLFVACIDTLNGLSKNVIKVCIPRTPPKGETYLQSLCDFALNINLETYFEDQIDEEIDSIGFSDIDNRILLVNLRSGSTKYYRMYFDYYFYDVVNKRLYTREDYSSQSLSVI